DSLLAGRNGVEDLYPLSPMQEGMLFHALSGGDTQPYQIQIAQRLEGPLDAALLRRALDEVVNRHASLRTAFVWEVVRGPMRRGGETVALPRRRPYRAYTAWLRRQDAGAAEQYWRRILAGFGAPIRLGVDRTAAPDARAQYVKTTFQLSTALTQQLEALARRTHVTLNTVLTGAWGLLLSRYSGEHDVVFGATITSRPAALDGVESVLGLLINVLPG